MSSSTYYNAHYQQQQPQTQQHRVYDDLDDDEQYSEDMFLQQHYGRRPLPSRGLGGLGLVHDDDDDSEDELAVHYNQDDDDDDDEDILVDEEDEEGDHEYNELDMDHQSIHLLSGSLSVRSPFLDAIREEEDEEPVFTKPSSYPSFGSSRFLNRNSIGESWANGGSGLKSPLSSSSYTAPSNATGGDRSNEDKRSSIVERDEQQDNFNNTNQSDGNKPRGPRPPLLIGRPRSNSSLTRVTTGFDIQPPGTEHDVSGDKENSDPSHSVVDHAKRDSSGESTIQDLEVKRVMEGAAAAAVAAAAISASNSTNSLKRTAAAATATSSKDQLSSTSKHKSSTPSLDVDDDDDCNGASFGQDTQKSIDDFFGMVKSDLDKRIQQAIQEVEQKFLDRVQRLEEHTATLSGAPFPTPSASPDGGLVRHESNNDNNSRAGSLMESLTRPLPPHQNPGGSLALRKEILSHVTEKVGDLDLRVNQMEVLVSYKLVDIESRVQDLHGAHNTIAQKVHQVAKTHKSKMQGVNAGNEVGEDTIKGEELRISGAMDQYRDMDEKVAKAGGGVGGGGAYLENLETNEPLSLTATTTSTALVDRSSIVELRNELQTLGMRYQELNDGLLTDLMGQMRDAKLMLFQTVDEVDGRISKRVDRIEAEMHSKLLSEIEGRVQERVRAMEQTSSRLERCFDKMEGRLGALETVLASRRPRPESMYQLLQQQQQQQQLQQHGQHLHDEEGGGYVQHAGTFAGFSSSPSRRSITSLIFSDIDGKAPLASTGVASLSSRQDLDLMARPRHRNLAESDTSSPNSPTPDSSSSSSISGSTNENNDRKNEDGLMMLEVADSSTPNTFKKQYAASKAMMSSPLDGFVSQAQAKPIWSSRVAAGSGSSTSTAIPIPSTSSASRQNMVDSPLERGTIIGGRMGTIHPLPHCNPTSPTTASSSYVPTTTYVSAKEHAERLASQQHQPLASSAPSSASRLRRVSLSSFDASSLSALKPVRSGNETNSDTGDSAPVLSTAVTTSRNGSATSTITAATVTTQQPASPGDRNRSLSMTTTSSSLLSSKLKNGTGGSSSDGGLSLKSSSSSLSSPLSPVGPTTSATSTMTATKTMQRAMTFDTMHSQATLTTKTSKTSVQGLSSYTELLRFWKTGGST
ncbi:hypothetical protein BG004_000211 [Podila humilis]|nr:hypothetical protein BG004_000211 [Podila humilis]